MAACRLLPVGLLLVHGLLVSHYLAPETSTTLSYASTLASGHGPALQPDAVWSLGFSSVLWVLLLTGANLAGLSAIWVAKASGLALAGAALLLLPSVSARLRGQGRASLMDLLPSLLLAMNPDVAHQAVGGLETSLTLLLLTITLWLFVAEELRFDRGARRPGDLWSALPLCLLLLNRPEAPLWFLALAAWRIMARAAARRVRLSTVVWLLVPPAFYCLYLVGSYALFAEPLSGVIMARQGLLETSFGHPLAVKLGWASLPAAVESWGVTLPLVALALLGAARHVNYWARSALLGLAVVNLGAVVASGDSSGRLLLPTLLAGCLLAAQGVHWVVERLAAVRGTLATVTRVALALGLLAAPAFCWVESMIAPPAEVESADVLSKLEAALDDLGVHPPQLKLLTSRPGLAAMRGFKVVDASGLTDPSIRRYNRLWYSLELQQLMFRERRPDIILEQGLWKVVHAFHDFPEARRLYTHVKLPGHPGVKLAISRALFLEPEPLADERLYLDMGDHLSLIGTRAEPGHLVLLWTAHRKIPEQRTVVIKLGTLLMPVQVGPKLYPTNRWRPGEVVRQRIAVPELVPGRRVAVSINSGGRWRQIPHLDGAVLRLEREQWFKRLSKSLKGSGRQDLQELLPIITRTPAAQTEANVRLVTGRIKQLLGARLLERAVNQLDLIQYAATHDPEVKGLAISLAETAYLQAKKQMRRSSWSSAFATLRAAARADPNCPWIARRLEETRQRLPAGAHFVELLELELAQRALVLAPSLASNLSRVLSAQLVLGRYQEAVAAYHAWSQLREANGEHAFLVAEAMNRIGWLDRATDLTDRPVAAVRHSIRCPPEYLIRTSFMHDEIRRKQGHGPLPSLLERLFKGRGLPLGKRSMLLAHCARWRPGSSFTVDLFILQQLPEALDLELFCGPKRQRITLTPAEHQLLWIRKRFALPPASYNIRLKVVNGTSVNLGTVVVGPESTFGFELPSYASWFRKGTAFGQVPVVGRVRRKRRIFGYVGERFADSHSAGTDAHTGLIKSPAFRIKKEYLMVMVSGGDDPALGASLIVEGKTVATVRGRRSEVLRAVFIPVARYKGRRARVVIRDHDPKHWGHIAVDEIRQLNGPAPGIAP